MRTLKILLILALSLAVSNAYASNITIWDKVGTGSGWHGGGEDQEVEPGMVGTQAWDLEAFTMSGTRLSMIGGYNFAAVNGYEGMKSGDIFFDVTGDVTYGEDYLNQPGHEASVKNIWGYDYAVHLSSFGTTSNVGTYDVYKIDENSKAITTFYPDPRYSYTNYRFNAESYPWKYDLNDTSINKIGSYSFTYESGLTNTQTELLGDQNGVGSHNRVTINLADFMKPNTSFTVHYTYECGNDNLMGKGEVPVPEPGTLLLLGISLIGLAGIRKRMRK